MSAPLVNITTRFPGTEKEPSLFDIYITSKSSLNPAFANGGSTMYDGWCINADVAIDGNGMYKAYLYSSYEIPTLQQQVPTLADQNLENLDSINWLLNWYDGNNDGTSWYEVQAAIWKLLGDTWQDYIPADLVDVADIDNIYNSALAHDGFVPNDDQSIGVIMDVMDENNQRVQPIIIETKPAKLGDYVWEDSDKDGIQDSNETGIQGVKVELIRDNNNDGDFNDAGEVLSTTTTDQNGFYQFKTLTPGLEYQVRFTQPEGFETSPRQVAGGTAANNSDGLVSDIVVLQAGEYNNTIDAGFHRPTPPAKAELGDRVWHDLDADGIQDDGEAGIAGATVKLLNNSGNVIRTTTTDASGLYKFTDLDAGSYKVQFDAISGFQRSAANQGSDDTKDSDAGANGQTGVYTLTAGQSNMTVDAGFYKLASLGDYVWHDKDKNGAQGGATDVAMAGVTVKLLNNSGTLLASTTTDATGKYLFDNLKPGAYKVQFVAPNGYVFTTQNATIDSSDSDANSSGLTGVYTLKSGDKNLTVDAGLYRPATAELGDRVWHDLDADGIQEDGEAGIAGATVKLLDNNGNVLRTTTTNAEGLYKFTQLDAGSYKVQFDAIPGFQRSAANQGSDDAKDSDAGANGQTGVYTLTDGQSNMTVDAGFYKLASLGDYVWHDKDKNGAQGGATDVAMAGVTVRLFDSTSGAFLASTTTDANGKYLFDNLKPGAYKVQFLAPNGYEFTTRDATVDNADSDADTNGLTGIYTLKSGDKNLTVDAGLFAKPQTAELGDRFWYDNNQNGIQDDGETGVAGARVLLYGPDGTKETTTDGSGYYKFSNLQPGNYQVEFKEPSGYVFTKRNAGSNDAKDSDADPAAGASNGTTHIISLNAGDSNMTVDAGIYKPAAPKGAIGDYAWVDKNENGRQDAGEPIAQNVPIYLYNATTGALIGTRNTDSNGKYLFDGLDAGQYKLFIPTNQNGQVLNIYEPGRGTHSPWLTWDNVGGVADSSDSDFYQNIDLNNTVMMYSGRKDANYGWSPVISLDQGERDMSWDVGLTPIVIDLNGDGIKTVSRANSGGEFDLLGNGSPIKSGWISGQDGFLAVDNNNDGQINDISELFGGQQKGDGFAKLASYDSNGDGVVNQLDALFANLRIWQDSNGNHQTDEGELKSLAEAGVTSLSTGFIEVPELDANGNLHLERSSATLADGTSVDMTDVYFNVSAADAAAAGVSLPTMAQLLSGNESLDSLLGGFTGPVAASYATADDSALAGLSQMARLYDQQAVFA